MSISKAPFLAAFFILLGLSACNPSWVTAPAADYIKKKTGIEIKVEKVSVGVRPFNLETKEVQLKFKNGSVSCDLKVPEMRISFGWTLSWEDLPWPKIHIEKVSINRPSILIRLPEPKKLIKWVEWAREIPAIRQIEVNDLKGRVGIGKTDFQLGPGTRVLASFSPDQGGKFEYDIKSLQGIWTSKELKFKAKSQGSIELSEFPDQPKWKGSFTLSEGNLLSPAGKVAQVSGTFSFDYQNHRFEITASPAQVQEIDWRKDNASFQGQGAVALSGTIRLNGNGLKTWEFSGVQVKFTELDFDFSRGSRKIKGKATGQTKFSGPFSKPIFNARLSTRQTDMDLPPVFTQGLETEIEIEGRLPCLSFPVVQAKADRTDWHLATGLLSIFNPQTRFSALLFTNYRQIHLKDIGIKTDNWGNLSGSLFFDSNKGSVPRGKAWAEEFPLPKLLKFFFPKATEPFPDDIPCQGTIEWSREDRNSPIVFLTSFTAAPFPFQIPNTDWQGEGIQVRINAEGKWFFREKKVLGILNQNLTGGNLSCPPWIFRFDQDPLKARFEGWVAGGKQAGLLKGTIGFQYNPLGEVKISGEWPYGSAPRFYSGSVEVSNLPLEKGFPLLVGVPFSEKRPFWEKTAVLGSVNARFSILKNARAYDIKGRVTGSGVDFKIQEPSFSFRDLTIDFPFHLSSPGIDRGKDLFSESGTIQMEEFQGPRIAINGLRFPVLAGTNQFEVSDKIRIPLWGGQVTMNSFKLTDPLGDFRIDTSISLENLELIRLVEGQGITGTLSGDLGPIRIDKEKAQIEGVLKAVIFDGTAEGKNWVIFHPFSPERRIQGDLFFNHLNLEPITQRFSFGKMTGYIQGRVSGLSFRHNRPEQFHLWVQTQEVPGVPKSIQLKAIENISLLGTGWGELDVLRQGINRWITEYDYQEIGLSCDLHNDRFSLRGTIVENGLEYLVRKPGWLGIDIINKNPDNEIDFSDILERIRSLRKKHQEGTGNESQ